MLSHILKYLEQSWSKVLRLVKSFCLMNVNKLTDNEYIFLLGIKFAISF